MVEAYKVHSILKQGVQIESIASYDSNVILGTRSGQLIMYSVSDSGAVNMLMFNKNFSKKPITQMEVVTAENLLFVLTDNIINVCDISQMDNNFSFLHNSPLTKGCTLFTIDVKTTQSTTGETSNVIRVCCGIKRRLHFFYWKVNILASPEFSVELKDIPKAICWVDDVICVGFKDEYVIYNIHANTPEKHDLIVTSSSHSVDPCICLLKGNIIGVKKDDYLLPVDPNDYVKRRDAKSNIQGNLDSSMAVIGTTKNTFRPMQWSSPLSALVCDEPYAIGRVANAVEVRSLDSNGITKETLVQTIPELANVKFLVRSNKGIVFAASSSELWCLRLSDIHTQRQQLLQQKRFQLAIELTNISDEPEEIKSETIRQIHMRFARELFSNKQFDAAMSEFEMASADPYDVIRLFPNLLNDQNKPTTFNEGNVPVPLPPVPQLEDKDLETALIALINFLASARQREIAKLRDMKSNSKSLLSIIDTTLLKCYLQTNDSLIAPLLRLNQCHFEESEKTLKKHDKISELIILYQTNGKHRKALELLQSQSTIEGSSLYGHDRTIRYLQELGSSHLPLILEFSEWVLKAHPEDGLRIFTENLIEVENLPRHQVLDYLISKHKNLVIPYLEHIINEWNDTNAFMHNVLIKKYREKVQSLMEELKQEDVKNKSEKENQLKEYRSKLYELLKSSEHYSPDAVIEDFPKNVLLEERALILGRLKEHEKVLNIYIKVLGDVEKATQYCEQNYENDNKIFEILVKIILNPSEETPYEGLKLHKDFAKPNIDVALEILNKYTIKIDPHEVVPHFPDDLPAYHLSHYLEVVLRHQLKEEHEGQIVNDLLEMEIERIHGMIRQFQKQYVKLTEFSVCPDCQKRFANPPAFVRYPNGVVVHLSCHDKRVEKEQTAGSATPEP